MIPPICELCFKDFRDEEEGGDLLYFKMTEKGREFEKRTEEEPGFTGHPPDAAWFCNEHLEEAKKLTHLTLDEAMVILRKKFKVK